MGAIEEAKPNKRLEILVECVPEILDCLGGNQLTLARQQPYEQDFLRKFRKSIRESLNQISYLKDRRMGLLHVDRPAFLTFKHDTVSGENILCRVTRRHRPRTPWERFCTQVHSL